MELDAEAEVKAVRDTFDAFVAAVKSADFRSYLGLHQEDMVGEVSEELFVKNSDKARDHKFEFDLSGIRFDGRYATVSFTVTPGDGAEEHQDEAELTLIRNEERWSLYET